MIKPRDTWSNPYGTDTRRNGIRTGRQGWRDQLDGRDQLDAGRGIVYALLAGFLGWCALAVLAVLIVEAMQ